MAEQERRSKAERRAEARVERKHAEQEAARQERRQSRRNIAVTVAVVAAVALVMVPAVSNWLGGGAEAESTISLEGALEARETAGCEMVVDGQPLPDSTHRDPATAPPADVMYANATVRPTHSGPHFSRTNQILGGIPGDPLDERSTTHNLEHGAVNVWFDPDTVEQGTIEQMEDWMRSRLDMGFESRAAGTIFVSPYPDMTGDASIALRAWGYALNCQDWDQDVADSFLIDYWGTHGEAPERSMSPYPQNALGYEQSPSEADDATPDEN